MQKLDPVKISWIIREKENGAKNADVAHSIKISTRWVQKLYSQYRNSENIPVLGKPGRPKRIITEEMREAAESAFEKFKCSAVFLEKILDADGIHIPHNTIHQILRSKGLAEVQPKKRKRRKWIRFERTYSNSMWHTRPLAQLTQFDQIMQIYSQQDPKLRTSSLFHANIQETSQKAKVIPVIYWDWPRTV